MKHKYLEQWNNNSNHYYEIYNIINNYTTQSDGNRRPCLSISHCEGNVVKMVDKVKLFHEYLITKFQARFYPGQELAVDETMVGFRGRFTAKQYMPQKPVKSGIKYFTLDNSST